MAIAAGERGICPHCNTSNRFEYTTYSNPNGARNFPSMYIYDGDGRHEGTLSSCRCTNCGRVILFLDDQMIFPLGSQRQNAPQEVPENIRNDFNEACLVENMSKKAAAALGRRCLQNLLHDRGIEKDNLSLEIDEAMKVLPSHLSDSIDSIRIVGNFAAHPIKSTNSGEIIDVENGETEWLLDTLEALFDFYYVQPTRTKTKREALDNKLAEAGKKKMK